MTLADIADTYAHRFEPITVVDRLRDAIANEEQKLLALQRRHLLTKWRAELRDMGQSDRG